MKKSLFAGLAAASLMITPFANAGSFLRLPDIDGESQHEDYENWIEFTALSSEISNPSAEALGGRVTARAETTGLTISKQIDASSPLLMRAVASGQTFHEAVIEIVQPGDGGPYISYTLHNVMISAIDYSIEGSTTFETIQLNFESISWAFLGTDTQRRRQGYEGTQATWDIARGTTTVDSATSDRTTAPAIRDDFRTSTGNLRQVQ
ncbi:type VI secretion system tube protein Hcp [Ponticaulis sp.]|uniref:Hcp family type VI secretion system effector n=1 Tax=Ponticaulis sp. TaxID=2020902 RepID=UPI000B72D641|nr:type VI secretion system tube protein Hcp [Ponticaulis sp.]MAI90144.1 hypothetical protein [Ponticaulis sp.]OUX99796.1 MAG: hypothetical protein CBB65_06865 [Hyphomonadaceae bacterium TMED5]|tara:strand:- start:105051 stop:105671 length:621 start_codon:yes stop_codon:yes gene_type:complete